MPSRSVTSLMLSQVSHGVAPAVQAAWMAMRSAVALAAEVMMSRFARVGRQVVGRTGHFQQSGDPAAGERAGFRDIHGSCAVNLSNCRRCLSR